MIINNGLVWLSLPKKKIHIVRQLPLILLRFSTLFFSEVILYKSIAELSSKLRPTIAIITVNYFEKLAVDAMIENKITFVRQKKLANPMSILSVLLVRIMSFPLNCHWSVEVEPHKFLQEVTLLDYWGHFNMFSMFSLSVVLVVFLIIQIQENISDVEIL